MPGGTALFCQHGTAGDTAADAVHDCLCFCWFCCCCCCCESVIYVRRGGILCRTWHRISSLSLVVVRVRAREKNREKDPEKCPPFTHSGPSRPAILLPVVVFLPACFGWFGFVWATYSAVFFFLFLSVLCLVANLRKLCDRVSAFIQAYRIHNAIYIYTYGAYSPFRYISMGDEKHQQEQHHHKHHGQTDDDACSLCCAMWKLCTRNNVYHIFERYSRSPTMYPEYLYIFTPAASMMVGECAPEKISKPHTQPASTVFARFYVYIHDTTAPACTI